MRTPQVTNVKPLEKSGAPKYKKSINCSTPKALVQKPEIETQEEEIKIYKYPLKENYGFFSTQRNYCPICKERISLMI